MQGFFSAPPPPLPRARAQFLWNSWKQIIHYYLLQLTGTRSRDGSDFCWHAWVYIGINEGRFRFLPFSVAIPSGKNYSYIFAVNKANPKPLHRFIVIYLVTIILLLIGPGCRALLPIFWRNFQLLRRQIWSLTNPTLLEMSKTHC